MNTADLLDLINRDDARLELSLRGSSLTPEHRTLIQENRDALLEHLARERIGTPAQSGLILYGDLLHNLMIWVGRYHELRLEHSGGCVLGVKPENITAL